MKTAPHHERERERLAALAAYEVLDTPPEPDFDTLVALASRLCETPVALISLVDADRQWFKARIGFSAAEAPRSLAFCAHAILDEEIMSVPDAREDERFADHPLVVSDPGVRFYAGAQIRSETGLPVGTLCVVDRVPRELTDLQRFALRTLADQVQAQLELRRALHEIRRREAEIRAQRDALVRLQGQKDELTALIVHDLKSPLQVVLANACYLAEREPLGPHARTCVRDVVDSVDAMHGMILNLLDIGRSEDGRLVPVLADVDVHGLLEDVRRRTFQRASAAGRDIEVVGDVVPRTVRADRDLLRRIVENLVDNALKYADAGTVRIEARTVDGEAEIRVRDEGPGIPADARERIFEKYARLDASPSAGIAASRGLGLAFCKLAAEAHGGRVGIEDAPGRGSVFYVRLPPPSSSRAELGGSPAAPS